jgi:5-methylcytosine-specific restriction endonuclease McrA
VQLTISREAHDKLRRAQDLLRHAIPDGNPAVIFERALTLLVGDLERKKLAVAKRHRPRAAGAQTSHSRHVPAAVKREVWARDGGRCAFVGTRGRCTERGFLELQHIVPFADGGATDPANLQLRCRAHNAYEAEEWFGPMVVREQGVLYGVLGPDRVEYPGRLRQRDLAGGVYGEAGRGP